VFLLASRAQRQYCVLSILLQCSELDVRTVPPQLRAGSRMLKSGWSRLFRNPGVAIVALSAGCLLNPAIARASCGDYVMIGTGQVPLAHSKPFQPTDEHSAESSNHRLPHCPCRGPGCSNGPASPLTPIPPSTDSDDRWPVIANDSLPNPVSNSNVFAEPLHIVIDGFRSSILRPPR
jgi:hypothetical protein